jgi:hypothetical protein
MADRVALGRISSILEVKVAKYGTQRHDFAAIQPDLLQASRHLSFG